MKTANQILKNKTKKYFSYLDHLLLRVGDKAFLKEVVMNINHSHPISVYDYAVDRCKKGKVHGEVALWIWEKVVEQFKTDCPKPYYPFARDRYVGLGDRIRRRNEIEMSYLKCF